ncbi:subtilase-type protease inhibitor [Streptomyces parvulus]|uniref:SSI family serine proteinase inhibitor n=1 Tax=Streptomyces parvulus TaxID=146923 RepID=UPI001E3CC499|nr:SSI family serine proteinase inhibitor [Streptomyces parvulus]MCC9155951.1 subtilase-type protease inhibitor [Streptomyces parvulus]MCE7688267.1 subtilase-type protease inhibitor [Streptomyces parvulus]
MFQVSRTPAARLLGAAAVSLASLASLSAAHPATATGAGASTGSVPAGDHLTVTVRDAGAGADGTFELYCNPGGGTHPDPEGACAAVERDTRWGQDAFAPVPEGSVCTMQYGGPATAHVTGVWAGRPVDVTYDRRDGCEISRWDRMVPLLPEVGARGRS